MFYSHEILTSRKYGVATIWIVATLGSKCTLSKKVTRNDILHVDVPKACETIVTPDAPMALRLQSNLLYGVCRVYDQKCQYVLKDAEQARDKMRMLFKVVRNADLDPEAGRAARPDQLLLPDDPNFLPDMALENNLLDLYDEPDLVSDHGSSQESSLLSEHSLRSPHLPSIIVPTSGNDGFAGFGIGDFSLGDEESRGGRPSSIVPGSALRIHDDIGFDPAPAFGFGSDGGMVDLSVARPSVGQETPAGRAGSVLSATERVRRDQEDAARPRDNMEEDDTLPPLGDDDGVQYDARPFSPRAPATGADDQAGDARTPSGGVTRSDEDEDFVQAPVRRARAVKPLLADARIELSNHNLRHLERGYLANMAAAAEQKVNGRAVAQAKRNADFWIWQMGVSGIGKDGGAAVAPGLDMFYGQNFIHAVLGITPTPQGEKRDRASAEGNQSDEEGRRVRPRTESPRDDEVGRGNADAMLDDDGLPAINNDLDDIEMGRNAPTPLPGDAAPDFSSAMPWNLSATQRRSALQQRVSRAGSVSSALPAYGRLTSASPLHGRGITLPDRLSRQGSLVPGQGVGGYTSSVRGGDFGLGGVSADTDIEMPNFDAIGAGNVDPDAPMNTQEAFETFGPAAAVDTQTAGQSQWIKSALDEESGNFLEFVHTEIGRRDAPEMQQEDAELEGWEAGSIAFETLLSPEANTAVVAAQALLHCLALATKGLLNIRQDEDFGQVWLRPEAARD